MAHYTAPDFQTPSSPSLHELYEDSRRAIDGVPEVVLATPAAPAPSTDNPVPAQLRSDALRSWVTLVAALIAGAALATLFARVFSAPDVAPVPQQIQQSAPTVGVSTRPAPTPAPTALPALPIGLALYFGPDSDAAPSIKQATTNYTATARYAGWIKLEIDGYAVPVWSRADAMPELNVADLPTPYKPTPTLAPVVITRQAPAPPPVLLDCTRERAIYIATRSSALGSAESWSCESQAQADARADARLAEINAAGKATR